MHLLHTTCTGKYMQGYLFAGGRGGLVRGIFLVNLLRNLKKFEFSSPPPHSPLALSRSALAWDKRRDKYRLILTRLRHTACLVCQSSLVRLN